jgi:hypothetical protein
MLIPRLIPCAISKTIRHTGRVFRAEPILLLCSVAVTPVRVHSELISRLRLQRAAIAILLLRSQPIALLISCLQEICRSINIGLNR